MNNMFSTQHYVPILKWKRAEQEALRTLKDKTQITPLVELVMPNYKGDKNKIKEKPEEVLNELILNFSENRIPKIPEEILKSWGYEPVFIDFTLLYTPKLKIEAAKRVMSMSNNLGLKLIPTLNLSDDQPIKEAISLLTKEYGTGICLRIVSADFLDTGKLNKNIKDFLSSFNLKEKDIDLLVDIKEIIDTEELEEIPGKFIHYANLTNEIINLANWKNFIFASGAFPKHISKCADDEPSRIPRFDWKNWFSYVKSDKFKRNPTFADYTVRHPIHDESLQFHHPTTTIKYTLENDWYILKGKKQRFEMYLANAKLLSEDTELFYGEDFSDGDGYIAQKGRHFEAYIKNPAIKGTGRNEDWIRACINHHIVSTASQLANSF